LAQKCLASSLINVGRDYEWTKLVGEPRKPLAAKRFARSRLIRQGCGLGRQVCETRASENEGRARRRSLEAASKQAGWGFENQTSACHRQPTGLAANRKAKKSTVLEDQYNTNKLYKGRGGVVWTGAKLRAQN
jgi:hypothetical protein